MIVADSECIWGRNKVENSGKQWYFTHFESEDVQIAGPYMKLSQMGA